MEQASAHRHTYTRQIIDYVHKSLREGNLKPGLPLTEQMLVDALGASRAPIREALQALTNEGLITTYPYKGRIIREMTPEEILDNAYLVGAIEGALVTRALPYLAEEDFNTLHKLVDDMENAARQGGNIAEMECLANDFHHILCGKRSLASFTQYTRRLCRDVSRILYYKYWKNIFTLEQRASRHKFVLNAVLTKDIVYIDAIVRRHQMEVGEGICRLMKEEAEKNISLITNDMTPESHEYISNMEHL